MKTYINTLQVGDTFSWMNMKSVRYNVTKIEDNIIYYTYNGKEHNCNYDKSLIFKHN